MLIFSDAEFTDFMDIDLISIALVSNDDRRFYVERSDFDRYLCRDFVNKFVLPQLGKHPECMMPLNMLRMSLNAWLNQFQDESPVLCFDHVVDFGVFRYALDNLVPPWIKTRNIKANLGGQLLEQFFRDAGLAPHHALNDALSRSSKVF